MMMLTMLRVTRSILYMFLSLIGFTCCSILSSCTVGSIVCIHAYPWECVRLDKLVYCGRICFDSMSSIGLFLNVVYTPQAGCSPLLIAVFSSRQRVEIDHTTYSTEFKQRVTVSHYAVYIGARSIVDGHGAIVLRHARSLYYDLFRQIQGAS